MTRPPPDYEIDWTAPERRSGMPIVVVFAAFCGVLGFAVGFAIGAPPPMPPDPAQIGDER